MKTIIKNIRSAAFVLALGTLAACSPESFDAPDYNKLPQADEIDVKVEVDQTTNQVTLSLNNKGVYPVWKIVDGNRTSISTRQVYKNVFIVAGTYQVEVQMGNRNGVCEGSKVVEFTIDNTLIDFTPYTQRLTNGESKTWKIANDLPGHLGCGPANTDGLEWWSAGVDEKKDWGFYDNRFTFSHTGATDAGKMSFDPGASGQIYVNTGYTAAPWGQYNTGDGLDFVAPAEAYETSFTLLAEGNDLFIQFPAHTVLGYLPNVEAYENPKFKILSMTNSQIDLVNSNNDIAWHYTLNLEGDAPFNGFKYDSEFNLWKSATVNVGAFYYAPGWAQIADPEYTFDNGTYTVTLPSATFETWQAQMPLLTDIASNVATNYDFSVLLTSSVDHPGVMVKLTEDGNDGNFFFEEKIALKAFEETVFYKADLAGIDAPKLKLVLDFGGNAENTVMTIRNIVLKDHANDDGTKVPDPTVTPDPTWVAEDSDDNLWHGATFTNEFYYAPGWNQIANPDFAVDGAKYTVSLPEATTDQWQAQVKFFTSISTSAEKAYDFRITLSSDKDLKGATVKLVLHGDDNTFYFADRVDLPAYEDVVYKGINMAGIDMSNVDLVLDFGGCQADTHVTVSGIILQEHRD